MRTPRFPRHRKLTVGSDCSGADAPWHAMQELAAAMFARHAVEVEFEHAFCSDPAALRKYAVPLYLY